MIFIDSPRVFGFLGYLWSKEAVREAAEVGTTHQGAPGPPGMPRWVVLPSDPPLVLFWPNRCLLVQKISPKSFSAFGLRLVGIFCEVKNKQKTATGTGHYVNRLVPKNDIKLL